jgi:hypothetical protein
LKGVPESSEAGDVTTSGHEITSAAIRHPKMMAELFYLLKMVSLEVAGRTSPTREDAGTPFKGGPKRGTSPTREDAGTPALEAHKLQRGTFRRCSSVWILTFAGAVFREEKQTCLVS